jgi:hypothetical protein
MGGAPGVRHGAVLGGQRELNVVVGFCCVARFLSRFEHPRHALQASLPSSKPAHCVIPRRRGYRIERDGPTAIKSKKPDGLGPTFDPRRPIKARFSVRFTARPNRPFDPSGHIGTR